MPVRPPCRQSRLAREAVELLDPALRRARTWTARELAELPEVRSVEEQKDRPHADYCEEWHCEFDAPDEDGYWGQRHSRSYYTRTWRGARPRKRETGIEAEDRELQRLAAAVRRRLAADVGRELKIHKVVLA